MQTKPKFIMMVGLPASGKSTEAKRIAEMESGVVLSSDAIRGELYGDETVQEDPAKVFGVLYDRARKHLEAGITVVVDATNISSKKRIGTLQQFAKYRRECVYMDTPEFECIDRDVVRKRDGGRRVGQDAIRRMYKQMQVPGYHEGWDHIRIVSVGQRIPVPTIDSWEHFLTSVPVQPYNSLFGTGGALIYPYEGSDCAKFAYIADLPHDNPHHVLSVGRHSYEAYRVVCELNLRTSDYKRLWVWTALLHDVGKAETKEFKGKYAHFYGHENVSAQYAIRFLKELGYDDEFAVEVATFVQLHMRLMNAETDNSKEKLRSLVGDKWYERLSLFRKIDEQAD